MEKDVLLQLRFLYNLGNILKQDMAHKKTLNIIEDLNTLSYGLHTSYLLVRMFV